MKFMLLIMFLDYIGVQFALAIYRQLYLYNIITYLFENLPNINFKIHPELLENFLPWDEEVQQNCK